MSYESISRILPKQNTGNPPSGAHELLQGAQATFLCECEAARCKKRTNERASPDADRLGTECQKLAQVVRRSPTSQVDKLDIKLSR